MIKNIGRIDRMIRVVISLLISILIVSNILTGISAIFLVIISILLLLTGITQFCPFYYILGRNTNKK